MKPSILEKLQQLSDRLEEVTHLLGQPEATSDMDNYRKLTREHAELTPVVEVFQNYQLAQSDLADAEEMLSDPEMKDFAAEEIEAAKAKIDELDTELQKLLLPKDADDDKNIFIEVRAGTAATKPRCLQAICCVCTAATPSATAGRLKSFPPTKANWVAIKKSSPALSAWARTAV